MVPRNSKFTACLATKNFSFFLPRTISSPTDAKRPQDPTAASTSPLGAWSLETDRFGYSEPSLLPLSPLAPNYEHALFLPSGGFYVNVENIPEGL